MVTRAPSATSAARALEQMGAAKGSWLDAHPQVRATLNAVWEMEPQTELLKLEQPRDRGPYTASTAIRVAKGHVSISYAVLIKELLELPELSDFDARVGSTDYKKLYRQVKSFIGNRRRTREQIRTYNKKARAKKRARLVASLGGSRTFTFGSLRASTASTGLQELP